MATLTGQKVKNSYKDLLQVSNSNSGVDGTLRTISDGEATDSVLQLSSAAVNVTGAGTLQYGGTAITSTAAEINVLDGYTGSVTELNYLDTLHATGVTSTEFDYLDGVTSNVQTQLDAKSPIAGATFTGTTTFATLSDGTIAVTAWVDEDNMSSDSATLIPTQQSVKAYVDAQITAEDLDATTDSGTIDIDLDSDTLTIAGGEGIDTSASGTTITITGEEASSSNKGVASFSTDNFSVSSGAVTIKDSGVILGTETTGNYVATAVAGTGISVSGATGNVTITSAITAGDGLTLNTADIDIDAAQTTITSIYNSGLALGYGSSHANIDFSTDNAIIFDIDGTQQIKLIDGVLQPITDNDIDLGTSSVEFKDAYFDGTVTSDAFAGPLTGDVTGNVSGTAATVTTAAQTSITSLGTLTALQVDNLNINGNTISSTAGTDLNITPLSGQQIVLDGTIVVDAGVVTGATSITSTAFVGALTGNVTGNASGTAATVTTAAQSAITSLGTLTTLTVDNVIINGTTIGHTSDTDLITLADGNVTIAGELDLTTLDVSGDADIDGTLEADAITVNGSTLASVIAGTTVTLSSTVTVTDSTANTNFPVVFHNESNALLDDTGALRYNPSTGTLLVPNLNVAGTTTQVDTVTMEAANAVIFEGATSDAYETTLSIVDPTADHTQYLINQGGYIPVLAAATTTAISSTPAELNVLDGVTAGTVAASLGVVVDGNKDIGSFRNITLTGELDAGSLDVSGDADIDGTLEADAITVDGTTLAEYIADTAGAMVSSNTESGITVAYQDGDNTIDFSVDAAQTGITSIYATDLILGEDSQTAIDFGTANEIDFKINNATELTLDASALYPVTDAGLDLGTSSLEFKDAFFDGTVTSDAFAGPLTGDVTGNVSGTAATVTTAAQPNITSLGTLTTLTVDNVIINGTTIGHTSDTDLITLADGNVTIAGELDLTTLDVSGNADIDGTLEADAITVNGTTLAEYISDTAGAMFSSNTETGIAATYQDGDNTIDLAVDYLPATDDRDVKPDDITTSGQKQIRAYFTTLGGMTGSADSDYQDMLVLDTYSDGTGGDANALIFDKSTLLIKHYLADQAASTWGTPKTIAYTDAIAVTALNNATANELVTVGSTTTELDAEANLTFDGTTLKITTSDGAEALRIHNSDVTITENELIGEMLFTTADTTLNSDRLVIGAIKCFAEENFNGANANEGSLAFYTANATDLRNSGSPTARMVIDEDGDVTIAGGSLTLPAAEKLYLDGSNNQTYLVESSNDVLDIYAGGTNMLRIEESGTDYVQVFDNTKFVVGTGKDLELYHDGTNSFIDNTTGYVKFRNTLSDADMYLSVNDGGSQINAITIDASNMGRVKLPNDNQYLTIGAGGDFYMYHDGSNSLIRNSTGNLLLRNDTDDGDIILQSDDGSGGVTAYLTLDGSATNVDVAQHLRIPSDSKQLKIGASEDLLLYHDGSNSHVQNGTGVLYINQVANAVLRINTNNTTRIEISADGTSTTVGKGANQVHQLHFHPRTGDNRKTSQVTAEPYDESREDVMMMVLDAQTGINEMALGSNTSSYESPNRISFYTASAPDSATNVEAVRIEADQDAHFDQDVIAFSSTPSDIRLKKNFEKIENGLDVINKLEGNTFNWKKDDKRLSAGFKAQEVEKILPHLIDEKKLPLRADDDKEYKVLRYEEIIPYLVEAIKEQQEEIELLKANYDDLKYNRR